MAGSTSLGSVSQECCTDASAAPQSISFLGTWLCCCVSDQLQNLPAGQQALPAPLSQLGCPAGTFWAGDSPVELRGRGRSSVLWHWVSLMALWHCHPSKASQEGGWSSSAGKHSTRLHRALGGGQGQGESGAGEEGGAQPQQLQRDIPCAAGCFWDLSWAQADVPAPVGWCGSLCLLLELPEKLLIQHA